jgi:hypothetical protein
MNSEHPVAFTIKGAHFNQYTLPLQGGSELCHLQCSFLAYAHHIGLTTGFIGSHTITVYTLLQLTTTESPLFL